MLKKAKVESCKESVNLDDRYASAAMVLKLIETIEEMESVIRHYAKDDVNGHKDGRFLSKYEGEG